MKITNTQLKELVKTVVSEETEYQTFFKKALEKTGKSIPSMSDEEKKEFFNKIDAAWKAKGEKNEGNAFGAAVTKAKEQGDDSFEVGGKTYKVESVNENKINIDKKVTNIINTRDFKKFVRYINSFYGKKGVYSSGKDVKEKDIMKALYNVFKRNNSYEWGDGDSVDREFVRDELMKMGILSDKMYEQEVNEDKPPKGVNLSIIDKEIKRRGKKNMLKHFQDIKKNKLYNKVQSPKVVDYLINYVSNFNESVNEGKKRFYQQDGIGKAKYTISYHDGKQKHKDGSDFYGIKTFRNKQDLEKFRAELLKKGYREDSGFKKESVNEARTVSKPIKVDDETMVQIVGDNKGFRELTAALNPKTGKPIQKFGYDRGNEIADSKEELIKKLQKKYGKSIKFESVNEGKNSASWTSPKTGKSYDIQKNGNRWEMDIMKKGSSIYDKVTTIKRKTPQELKDWLDGYKIDSKWMEHLLKSVNEGLSLDIAKHMSGIHKGFVKVEGDGTMVYDSPATAKKAAAYLNSKKIAASSDGKYLYIESVNEGKLKKFDDVHIKSKNLSGMVYKISGNTVVVRTIDGLVKAKKDDVTKIHNDNVNEDLGTIALGVMGGIGLYKILKFALKKVGVAVGSRVSLPKESLHKIVEQTHQALIKNFIKGDKTLNMMEIASLSKLLKDYIDDGTIKNAKDIQTYSKRAIEAIIKKRK